MTHAWHDVMTWRKVARPSLRRSSIPSRIQSVKYELDKETGLLKLDRILHSAVC